MVKVLFVCLGNICRSPMAEAVFAHQVRAAGLSARIQVDSAGTGDWHVGEIAHEGTLDVLAQNRIPYNGRARQFSYSDFDDFDYILAMDRSNLNNITRAMNRGERSQAQKAARFTGKPVGPEIALFLSYANRAGTVDVVEVPDPYYDDRFEYVYELVNRGCAALLDHIRRVHHL